VAAATAAVKTLAAEMTQTIDAQNSLTPAVTLMRQSEITQTVAAVTALAATRAVQTAQSALPTPQATPADAQNNTGNGGQTLLVAILIALGLIVVAFSQATRRR